MTPSKHLIPCHPLLLLPSIFPSTGVFFNDSAFHIRWLKYWSSSVSISPSNEYSGLISFRIDWFDLLDHHKYLCPVEPLKYSLIPTSSWALIVSPYLGWIWTRMTPAPAKSIRGVCTRGRVARLAARASGMEFVDVNRLLTLKPGCGTPGFFTLAAEPYCTVPAMVCYAIPYHTIPYHTCYPSFWLLTFYLWRFYRFLKAHILQVSGYNVPPGLWGIKRSWKKWQRELYLTAWEPESAPVT